MWRLCNSSAFSYEIIKSPSCMSSINEWDQICTWCFVNEVSATIELLLFSRKLLFSCVTQFTSPPEMKPSKQTLSLHEAFFTHKSNFGQASSRGVGCFSLYCPLSFDYGAYRNVRINLRMIITMHLILFNNMSLPRQCESITPPSLKTQALEEGWGTCLLSRAAWIVECRWRAAKIN